MSRIDPELEIRAQAYLVERLERTARSRSDDVLTTAAGTSEAPKVHIAVKFGGDIDDLTALGLTPLSVKRHASLPFAIAFGTILSTPFPRSARSST